MVTSEWQNRYTKLCSYYSVKEDPTASGVYWEKFSRWKVEDYDEVWDKLMELPERNYGLPNYSAFNSIRNTLAVKHEKKEYKASDSHPGIPPLAKFIWRYSIVACAHKKGGDAGMFSGRDVHQAKTWLKKNATQADVDNYRKYCQDNEWAGWQDRTGFIPIATII